ncbi:MAG: hypothetical protein CR967_02290 [Proteobacteria bacterium]|nr:MAG: hypothetical protein CR967_02290 [Pseudomonadota bacterium]
MYKKAWQEILKAKSILLISHIRPDGDTLGSVLALYLVLRDLGKRVSIYNPSPTMPSRFDFLPNIRKIKNEIPKEKIDLAIACDCGSWDRTGFGEKDFTLINLDHHSSNDNFGDINIVKPDMPSATMVVYDLLRKNDIILSKEVALCLYVGFVEDTGFLPMET